MFECGLVQASQRHVGTLCGFEVSVFDPVDGRLLGLSLPRREQCIIVIILKSFFIGKWRNAGEDEEGRGRMWWRSCVVEEVLGRDFAIGKKFRLENEGPRISRIYELFWWRWSARGVIW